jgi:signal transduction histidine kinase
MISLRRRLGWGLVLSLVLLLALQWLAVTWAIRQLTEDQFSRRLMNEGETLLAGVRFDPADTMSLDVNRVSAMYERPFSGHYYVVVSGMQRNASRSLWDAELPAPLLDVGTKRLLRLPGPEQQPLLAAVQVFEKQGRPVTIMVAEDLTSMQQGLARFQAIYAAVSVAGLALLLLIQHLIVRTALQPLDRIRDNLVRLGQGEAERVEPHGPTEIMPLIDELNRLLEGMTRRTRRSREALGNLAHALKTRLTLLNQLAEQPDTPPELRHTLLATAGAMRDIVERELKRARVLGDSGPGRRIDLEQEIGQLLHTMRMLHPGKNFTWEISPDAHFVGDREDLLELLGNLLDNAGKWCRKQVVLTVSDGENVRFVVEDDGLGCDAADLNVLTDRGYRADESQPGSGLGLAIVRDIVESYGGTLNFASSATLGGLRVEVVLARRGSEGADIVSKFPIGV